MSIRRKFNNLPFRNLIIFIIIFIACVQLEIIEIKYQEGGGRSDDGLRYSINQNGQIKMQHSFKESIQQQNLNLNEDQIKSLEELDEMREKVVQQANARQKSRINNAFLKAEPEYEEETDGMGRSFIPQNRMRPTEQIDATNIGNIRVLEHPEVLRKNVEMVRSALGTSYEVSLDENKKPQSGTPMVSARGHMIDDIKISKSLSNGGSNSISDNRDASLSFKTPHVINHEKSANYLKSEETSKLQPKISKHFPSPAASHFKETDPVKKFLKIVTIYGDQSAPKVDDNESVNHWHPYPKLANDGENLESCSKDLYKVFTGPIDLPPSIKEKYYNDSQHSWQELEMDIEDDSNFANRNNPVIDGCWAPVDCIPDQYLAIIVPFRNRYPQVKPLSLILHKLLQKQRRAYCLMLIEQADNGQFNRAKLMNIGFLEMQHHNFFKHLPARYGQKYYHLLPRVLIRDTEADAHNIHHKKPMLITRPNCYSFHDVDMIPEDDRIIYACLETRAIHQCDKYSKYNYKTQFASGGHVTTGLATLISHDQYRHVNGHPNIFYGWGVEDIEMAERLRPPINRTAVYEIPGTSFRYEVPVNEDLEKLIKIGITDDGGGPGFTRMEAYGRYFNVGHLHGFTSGPIMMKSHTDKYISGNNIEHHKVKAKYDLTLYDIIPSPFDKDLLRLNFRKFKEFRNNKLINIRPNYPNGRLLDTQASHFDGVMDTSYSKLGYYSHKFYGRYLVDLRPASIDSCVIKFRDKELLNIQPDQHLGDECTFVRYKNATLMHPDEIVQIDVKEKVESLPYQEKLEMALDRCERLEKIELGECNAFSLAKPTSNYAMPHSDRTRVDKMS